MVGDNRKYLKSNISSRILATIIDFAIYLPIWIFYIFYFGELDEEGASTVSGVKALPLALLWLAYFPGMEAIRGQTLGHMLAGIKVVTISGGSISFLQALKRRILDGFEILGTLGIIAFIAAKNTDKNQRVGDLFAKTIVIGKEVTYCENCNEKLSLSISDNLIGHYICPSCNEKNHS